MLVTQKRTRRPHSLSLVSNCRPNFFAELKKMSGAKIGKVKVSLNPLPMYIFQVQREFTSSPADCFPGIKLGVVYFLFDIKAFKHDKRAGYFRCLLCCHGNLFRLTN